MVSGEVSGVGFMAKRISNGEGHNETACLFRRGCDERRRLPMIRWTDYDRSFVRRRYDRIAGFFPVFEWLFLLPPGIRRRAVARLELEPGDRVLEVGVGTGRNLPPLVAAVGPSGLVHGVDLSEGMLKRARARCARRGWSNVTLVHADAAGYAPPEPVAGVIFSLSYATMPHHLAVLRHAWAQLRPGGRLVIMDAKLPANAMGRLMRPFVVLTSRATVLGNPDIEPWSDLRELTDDVAMKEESFGTYYVCCGRKVGAGPPPRHGGNTLNSRGIRTQISCSCSRTGGPVSSSCQ